MAHILVIGASQGIGQATCQAADARRRSVRAMSRSGRMPSGVSGNCEAFAGDALKPADVARARRSQRRLGGRASTQRLADLALSTDALIAAMDLRPSTAVGKWLAIASGRRPCCCAAIVSARSR